MQLPVPTTSLYVPGGHGRHDVRFPLPKSSLKKPGSQPVHSVAPLSFM